jgi:hypothetical protein
MISGRSRSEADALIAGGSAAVCTSICTPFPGDEIEAERPDHVELALAKALSQAAEAGRFDVVAQLARELEARRLARLPNVVPLSSRGAR